MVQIVPAILSTKEEDFQRDISKYNFSQSLVAGWVHIDFMDGIFVQNKSISPRQSSKYPTNLFKEAHLMVVKPLEWIDDLIEAGFKRIIFHIESENNPQECIDYVKNRGVEVGLAININTPLEKLVPYISKIDLVLVMSIEPGFQKQPFIQESLGRIKELKNELLRSRTVEYPAESSSVNHSSPQQADGVFWFKNKNWEVRLSVDGGVNDKNAKDLVEAGVDYLVIGSFLLEGDVEENLENLWTTISA